MKKAVILTLLFIYSFTTLGISVKADYCCNNLKSVKLVLAHGLKDKDGCCKVKYQSLLIKDAHAAADYLVAPALHFTFIHTLNSLFETTDFASQSDSHYISIHAPPLYQTTPIYISNCIFRI